MKRSLLIPLVALISLLIMSSCKEDEYVDWKTMNDNWLENIKLKYENDSNFHITNSGLCYRVIFQGNQRFPDKNSIVTANFVGKLIDGSTFDSGEYYDLLGTALDGFQEGVSKMQNGGHYILYIPSSLGYGTSKDNAAIPPNSTLIFDINLINSFDYNSY